MKSIQLVLFSFLCVLTSNVIYAQSSFRYQAVVRDSTGAVMADQFVNVQFGVIQINEFTPPKYVEAHLVTTNAYGVINLNVGEGESTIGDFSNLDWSLRSFLEVKMDVTGGSNYTLVSQSEILSNPKAIYAEKAGSFEGARFGILVTDFGAKGDQTTDDTEAIQAAIDSAQVLGCKVFVPNGIYKITKPLILKDGVSLIGEGTGSQPLETPFNGSLLWYSGDDFAIKVMGHNTKIKDLILKDKSEGQAKGGIVIEANGRLVESVYLLEVLVSGFTSGTGLKLHALNAGGIAYANFNNFRVRHGKIGIHILQDKQSFVNSNTMTNCQVSGGGFDYGLLVEGGNNNILNGLVIEPPQSNQGHLYVKEGEIFGNEIRIEGTQQSETNPLIFFAKKTKNSTITGVYAGGLTLDKGNNLINMRSGKAIMYRNSSFNKFRNATFFSPGNNEVPDWILDNDQVEVEVLSPELTENHNVIKFTIPAGVSARFEPELLYRPKVKDLPLYEQVNFGFNIKTKVAGIANTFTNATKGWTKSVAHSGSDEWEFVGMNADVDRNQQSRFTLLLNNTTNKKVVVYATTPTLTFGMELPTLDEAPLFDSGGQLRGLLVHAYSSVTIPKNGFLAIPITSNYFEVTNDGDIRRLNHLVADRFPKGSIITLLFDQANIRVYKSGYLELKHEDFLSLENSSLTLMSNGNGTWREVNRNN